MSGKFTVKFTKKGGAHAAPAKKAKVGDAVLGFELVEGNGDIVTVFGTNAAGDRLDISGVATLDPAPTSDNTTALTVDPPVGMTYHEKGLKAGSANVLVTATWTDGSKGPFSFTDPVTCKADPNNPTGLILEHGTPIPN